MTYLVQKYGILGCECPLFILMHLETFWKIVILLVSCVNSPGLTEIRKTVCPTPLLEISKCNFQWQGRTILLCRIQTNVKDDCHTACWWWWLKRNTLKEGFTEVQQLLDSNAVNVCFYLLRLFVKVSRTDITWKESESRWSSLTGGDLFSDSQFPSSLFYL